MINGPESGRPADVDTGFWLWLVALPLLLAGQIAEALTAPAPAPVARSMVVAITAFLSVIVASVVLTLLLLVRAGHRWARTVLTGGAVATIVYTAVSLFGVPRPTLAAVVYATTGIIGSVLIGGGIFLLHRPDAHRYFVR